MRPWKHTCKQHLKQHMSDKTPVSGANWPKYWKEAQPSSARGTFTPHCSYQEGYIYTQSQECSAPPPTFVTATCAVMKERPKERQLIVWTSALGVGIHKGVTWGFFTLIRFPDSAGLVALWKCLRFHRWAWQPSVVQSVFSQHNVKGLKFWYDRTHTVTILDS